MADYNLPTFEQLVEAQKGLGPAGRVEAAESGLEKGLSLADQLNQRKIQMMQEQEMMNFRKANFMKAIEGLGISKERLGMQEQNIQSQIEQRGKPKVVPQFTTSTGQPVVQTKEGKLQPAETTEKLEAAKGIMSPMANVREELGLPKLLPSNSGSTTVPGAASQMLLAAKTGRAILSSPKLTPTEIQLALNDLSRLVQRSAPQLDTIRGLAGFTNTLKSKIATWQTLITSKPETVNVPEIVGKLNEIFNELESTAKPFVDRQLKLVEPAFKASKAYGPNWENTKKLELGELNTENKKQTNSPAAPIEMKKASDFLSKYGIGK